MARPKMNLQAGKNAGEIDILAPVIPRDLDAMDLSNHEIGDDDVLCAGIARGILIEDVRADNVSISRFVFDGCTFQHAALHGLDVTDVCFQNCSITNVDFGHALIHRTVFKDCNLTGIDMREATFRNVVFENCIMRYSFFRSSDMDRTAFRTCRMENADFQQVKLANVFFSGCNMKQTQMSGTALAGIDLSTCEIDGIGVRIEDLTGAIVAPAQAAELCRLMGVVVKY